MIIANIWRKKGSKPQPDGIEWLDESELIVTGDVVVKGLLQALWNQG